MDFLKMTFGTNAYDIFLTIICLYLFILLLYKSIDFFRTSGKFDKNFILTMKWTAGCFFVFSNIVPTTIIPGLQGEFNSISIFRAKFYADWSIAIFELAGNLIGLILVSIITTYLIRLFIPIFSFIHNATNKNPEEQVIKNSNNDVQSENFGTKMENYAKRLDDSSDRMVISAKIKMLDYYKNSPVYYWYQILVFSSLMSVPLTLLIFSIIDYFFQGSIKYDYEFIGIYLTCLLLISTNFHNHYQK
tara:strand:+ start:127 stop:864 length:738 start_codon:yes stop_codon:yes gene_type:complete